MSTTPLSIAETLKYAQLQMAAEAFLVTGPTNTLKPDLAAALTEGNHHPSKFPTKEAAADFLDHWQVVAQQANTASGFSGTLFRARKDDPASGVKEGDLVISFRSTEFLDDALNDCQTTNKTIKDYGWAFGQLADMEDWYQKLKDKGDITGSVSVTGYSLGGHLATAFNLLHAHPSEVGTTVTFNGAGVGTVTDSTLKEVINDFNEIRNNVGQNDGLFQTEEVKRLYQQIVTRQMGHVQTSESTAEKNDMNSQAASWAADGSLAANDSEFNTSPWSIAA